VSTGPDDKSPLVLGPLADAYEPTDADAERVFAKIQAALGPAAVAAAATTTSPASASTPSAPPTTAAGAGFGKKAVFVGLSCAALALFGTFAATRSSGTSTPVAAPSVSEAPAVNAPEKKLEAETAPAIPSVSVDSLPTAATAVAPPKAAPVATTVSAQPSDTLEREARLLADARQARQSGDGNRALALLDEHARTFPSGWLASDRAAERIVVLCGLGRRDEAVREANVFLNGRPKGPLTRRVELSCAGAAGSGE
jgi:hypothetical protein